MDFDQELAEHLRQLRDPDPKVRSGAAGWLGALSTEGTPAIAPLYEACQDENMHVRGEATYALVEIAKFLDDDTGWELLIAGVPTLIALLDDPWLDVRCSAMSLLEELSGGPTSLGPATRAALPRLRALLTEENPTLTEHPERWSLEAEIGILRKSAAEAIEAIEETESEATP